MMESDEIRKIVEELDQGISKSNAAVRIDTCDPNDLYVTATENGYMRIGVEFLKAAFAPQQKETNNSDHQFIKVDTEYLITKDSSTDFFSFERIDKIVDKESQEETLSDKLVVYLILAVLIAIPILAVIGLAYIVRSLLNY